MTTLQILAAGSLRAVWPALIAAFRAQSNLNVETDFDPAGMLRQRIEAGERCDFFSSANRQHPEALLAQHRAIQIGIFAANTLCLTIRRDIVTQDAYWLAVLMRDDLRLATSTPQCDPSGDYTWQLFDNIENMHCGFGEKLRSKARPFATFLDSDIAQAILHQHGFQPAR
jgi:molybdate transport system substrate-binding protein